jgi:hypothetical protein
MNNRHSGLDALSSRREPSLFQRFWWSPVKFLAKALYSLFELAIQAPKDGIRVVCISDTLTLSQSFLMETFSCTRVTSHNPDLSRNYKVR